MVLETQLASPKVQDILQGIRYRPHHVLVGVKEGEWRTRDTDITYPAQ